MTRFVEYTLDEFMETYLCPFYVKGVYLEDIQCLYTFYKHEMLACDSISEMKSLRKEFQFLTWGGPPTAWEGLTVERIKELYKLGVNAKYTEQELENGVANILVPIVMLKATFIRMKFGIPEYAAAVQYVASLFPVEESLNE